MDRPNHYNSRKKVSLCSQYSSYRTPKSRFFCLRILATLAASRFFCLRILATLAACWNKLLTKPVHLAHCSHFLVCGFDHRAIHVRCLIYSFRCVSGVCLMSLRFHAVVVHAPSMVVLSLMMPGSLGAQREGGVQVIWCISWVLI